MEQLSGWNSLIQVAYCLLKRMTPTETMKQVLSCQAILGRKEMQHQQERRKDGQEDPWLTMALILAKHTMMNVEIEVLVQLHLTWASQPNHGSISVIG